MRVVLRFDGRSEAGGAPLLMHNERLSDPLDDYCRAVKEISSKRAKTDADLLEMARREFEGGLYMNGNGPCIPADNVLACMVEGARKFKLGKQVDRGLFPLVAHADLLYEGPRDAKKLWKDRDTFSLRKGVNVMGRKVIRTRPLFSEWALEFPFQVDPDIFDLDDIEKIINYAGHYIGLGDRRPRMGRFSGSVLSEEDWLKQGNGNQDAIWNSNTAAITRILKSDGKRAKLH
jgi:hypothetical protein